MRHTAVIALALTLSAAIASPAISVERSNSATDVAAKKKHPKRAAGGQIACTVFGCHPVPPGCHPERGFDAWGNPLSYDLIVCR